MASNGTLDLVGLDGRDNINRDALMTEDIGSDPSITAVVAKATKDNNVFGREFVHTISSKLASMLHKRSLGGAFLFNEVLET